MIIVILVINIYNYYQISNKTMCLLLDMGHILYWFFYTLGYQIHMCNTKPLYLKYL